MVLLLEEEEGTSVEECRVPLQTTKPIVMIGSDYYQVDNNIISIQLVEIYSIMTSPLQIPKYQN